MKLTTTIIASALFTTLAIAETPAPTTTTTSYDEELKCWPISVDHDATYCIDGPICSGSGDQPTGWKCPVAGDVAISDCHTNLVSYTEDNNCALPVDTACQVIHTGAWGCVISTSKPTPSPTSINSSGASKGAGVHGSSSVFNSTGYTGSGSGSGWTNAGSNSTDEDIKFSSVMDVTSATTVSAGVVATVALAAAAVCATVGTILYKRHRQQPTPAQQMNDIDMMFEVRTP